VRQLMLAVAALLALVVAAVALVIVVAAGWGHHVASGYTHEDRAATAPLAAMSISRNRGKTDEIYAELTQTARISDVLDVTILRGLSGRMTDEDGARVLGRASGKWTDPVWATESSYYDVPLGRISLARVRGEYAHLGWATMAYPVANRNDRVIRDGRLLAQLLPLLHERQVQVTLRQAGEPELRVSLDMTRTTCASVHLLIGSI